MKFKILTLLFAIKNLLSPDLKEKKESHFKETRSYSIERMGTLPDSLLESSGLEICKEGQTFWTHGDGGTKNQLYEMDKYGNVLSVLPLPEIENRDWEELAKDEYGNLYVCDLGNNLNRRTDLCIYKINPLYPSRIDTIRIRYEDQTAFPPEKERKNYDCEAVFWHHHSLYLLSKNRGQKYVKIYIVPDTQGNHVARITDSIFMNSPVTAADISPDKKNVVLLSYGKIYFFKTEETVPFKLIPYTTQKFNRSAIAEAIVYINNEELLITNEQREVFLMSLKLKAKK